MNKLADLSKKLIRYGSTNKFFWLLVGIFVAQAVWIALTGKYPMAFDENYHFGLIQFYSHHLNPFLSSQPKSDDIYGAMYRDPSYLYHYLMSFPYRLISLFTHDQTIQVIILRFINVALFASCLPLYRKLIKKVGASDGITNLCFLIFILLPVAPLLGAQINYDNLLLPVVALALLMALNIGEELENKGRINGVNLLLLAIVCLLGSLVKYAFLPIFVTIILFLAWRFWRYSAQKHQLKAVLRASSRRLRGWQTVLLVLGVCLSLVMFGQRYGINLVRYHTPVPGCGKVLSVQRCESYSPWARDYAYTNNKPQDASKSPIVFMADWMYGMWLRLFFAVDGPDTGFETRGPFLLPGISSIVFAAGGVLLLMLTIRRLWRTVNQQALVLLGLVVIIYAGILWLDNYGSFRYTGQPVAINGRYLFPIMIPFLMLLALAYSEFFKRIRDRFKVTMVYVMVFCMLLGGGALTYILRSNDDWYWPSPVVKKANHAVQHVVGPITPGHTHPSAFLH